MNTIRRVAVRGRAADAIPGLGLKVYGVRKRCEDSFPVNPYAPLSLRTALDAITSFLPGEGSRGKCLTLTLVSRFKLLSGGPLFSNGLVRPALGWPRWRTRPSTCGLARRE